MMALAWPTILKAKAGPSGHAKPGKQTIDIDHPSNFNINF
jgi:hypothetical protein